MKLQFDRAEEITAECRAEIAKLFDMAEGETVRVVCRSGAENRYALKDGVFTAEVKEKSAFFRGLLHLFESGGRDFEMTETRRFDDMGIMLDCSRNAVYTADAVKRLIRILAALGYNALQLYTEDTYEISEEPYFGYMRGRFTKDELKELDRYAAMFGVELVPCIQTLAHLNSVFRWSDYAGINDTGDILLLGEARTYELIENMFRTLAECFTSRRVNVGMDEAHMLGRGQYLDRHGLRPRPEIMREHVEKVVGIAAKYGFRCMMWSDMYFKLAFGSYYEYRGEMTEEVRRAVPENLTLIYWDYYSTDFDRYDGMLKKHREFDNPVAFAGGAWMWKGFTPSNRYSIDCTRQAYRACMENGVKSVFLTMWGDNGGECSAFMLLPALAFGAELSYGKGEREARADVAALTGLTYDDFLALDLPDEVIERRTEPFPDPSKYLLYNDPLMGVLDSTIDEGIGADYARVAARLARCASSPDWGYLFRYLGALCSALELKADLGPAVRRLYAQNNRAGMARLIETRFTPLAARLEEFYDAFLAAWNTDKKPHGFDVQDIRLGGLMRRVRHAAAVLWDWAAGKTQTVPELEEKLLDFLGGGEKFEKTGVVYNAYCLNATQNVM